MNFRNREPRFMQRCLFKMQSVSLYLNQRKMSKSAKQKAVEAVIISVVVVGGHHRFALGFINITYLS